MSYLAARPGVNILRTRLGDGAVIQAVEYGEIVTINGVRVSLHPAGHILGSAQVRVECGGDVWVVSGDYKTQADPTCAPFEVMRCNTFITGDLCLANLQLAITGCGYRPDQSLVAVKQRSGQI